MTAREQRYCWYLVPDRVGWCWAGRDVEDAPPPIAAAVIVVAHLGSDAPVLFSWRLADPSPDAIRQWRDGLKGVGWLGGAPRPVSYHRSDVAFRGGVSTRWPSTAVRQ